MSSRARDLLIATLRTEPQVVTIALDRLLRNGYPIREVCVVHATAAAFDDALTGLRREFERAARGHRSADGAGGRDRWTAG